MAATATVYITVSCQSRSGTDLTQKLAKAANEPHQGINALVALLERVLGGAEPARVYCAIDSGDGTAGTCTITCTDANYTAGETLTIAGVTFTIVEAESADPTVALTQLVAQGSDALSGTDLKEKINLHSSLKGMVTATDNGAGVVTLTFKDKGMHSKLCHLSETGDAFAVTQPTNGDHASTLAASLRAYDKS